MIEPNRTLKGFFLFSKAQRTGIWGLLDMMDLSFLLLRYCEKKRLSAVSINCRHSGQKYLLKAAERQLIRLLSFYNSYGIIKDRMRTDIQDVIPLFIDMPMLYPLGDHFHDNSGGFVILALIMETITNLREIQILPLNVNAI